MYGELAGKLVEGVVGVMVALFVTIMIFLPFAAYGLWCLIRDYIW